MKFNLTSTLENKAYTITISATLPTDKELEKAEQFGVLKVDAGGTFDGPPLFSLPPQVLHIDPRNVPFTYQVVFNGNQDSLASRKATAYIPEIRRRITSAKADWDSQIDIVNSEEFTLNLN